MQMKPIALAVREACLLIGHQWRVAQAVKNQQEKNHG